MRIAGVQKCSLVDWPGMVSAALFVPGCSFDCSFCHNRHLLRREAMATGIESETVIEWLEGRQGFTDGVVITGGEPTDQPELMAFIGQVRRLGFPVKLDTNGARPDVIARLLEYEALDYVAMDVKAPREKYDDVCGVPVDGAQIDASICLLRGATIEYEFRTTALPGFTEDDIVSIARRIAGASRYVLQQYRPPMGNRIGSRDLRLEADLHDASWFERVIGQIDGLVESCETRGVQALAFATSA